MYLNFGERRECPLSKRLGPPPRVLDVNAIGSMLRTEEVFVRFFFNQGQQKRKEGLSMTLLLEGEVHTDAGTRERVRESHGRSRCSAPQQIAESVRSVAADMLCEHVTELLRVRQQLPSVEVHDALVRAAREIVECLRAAVAHSVVVSAHDPLIRAEFGKTAWETVQKVLPGYDEPAACRLVLGATSAHSPCAVALAEEIARYAGALVERGLLGFIVYRADQTGAYSYVLRRTTVLTDDTRRFVEGTRKIGVDPQAPIGQRVTYRAIEDHQGTVRRVTEEHVHHLQGWRETPLSSAGLLPMAPWARRVRDVIPAWIARHVQVVEGTIVLEEVHERDAETNEWRLPRVARVWKASPAFRLGDLVLTGWSSSDLLAKASAEDQPWLRAARRRAPGKKGMLMLGGGIAVAAAACLIPGVWPAVVKGATLLLGLKRFV